MNVKLKRITSAFVAIVLAFGMTVCSVPFALASDSFWGIPTGINVKENIANSIYYLTNKTLSFLTDETYSLETEEEILVHWTTTSSLSYDRFLAVGKEFLQQTAFQLSGMGYAVSLHFLPEFNAYCIAAIDGTVNDEKYGPRFSSRLNGLIFCTEVAQVPVCFVEEELPEEELVPARYDQWIPISSATSSNKVAVLSKDTLSTLCLTANQTDRTCSVRDTVINDRRFYIIIDSSNNIYANADGVPYVAHYEATATDVKYDYIVNEGDTIDNSTTVDNSQVIDLSNGTFNYIDESGKQEFSVDELIYDFSTQSYSADTYNVTYNNDTYTNYHHEWNVTYNVTNTYVTNIGQTELYEPLELYYELPDGRSSADLTAAEVAGMSFEFADCVNYEKSATDTYLRALYHFDGDIDDSSYFSTQGSFEWKFGASISYMDVETFGGALYLDPQPHIFDINLPSNIGSGDFTLQFRYYQAGNEDTANNIENYVSVGGSPLMYWDDQYIYSGSEVESFVATLNVGSWQELALIRHNGTLYLYQNGLCLGSSVNNSIFTGKISFHLGNTTRAYSMLDELRFVNFAVAESGESYTCTAVPYDTNAVLVLPNSAFAIADEYLNVNSSNTNILTQYGLDDWTGTITSLPSYFSPGAFHFARYSTYSLSPDGYLWNDALVDGTMISSFPQFYYNRDYLSYSSYGDGVSFERNVIYSDLDPLWSRVTARWKDSGYSSSGSMYWDSESGSIGVPTYGFFSILASKIGNTQSLAAGTYTFSLVNSSGDVSSVSFLLPDVSSQSYSDYNNLSDVSYVETAFGYEFGIRQLRQYDVISDAWSYAYFLVVTPVEDNPERIMYMELAEGSSTDLTAELINCVYSSEDVKPNTAAIHTDIPINGYTVGGVRPTFPVRGDVWMPVSGNRISGCYLYNGAAWEQVNARWYTGSRWIPIYAFDLTTLKDCWDIVGIDNVHTQIGSDSDFWNWWKDAWYDFIDRFSDSGGFGNGSGDGSASDDSQTSSILSMITEILEALISAVCDLLLGIFDFLTTTILGGVNDFFSVLTDGSLFDVFLQTNDNGSTSFSLSSGIAVVFTFFSSLFMLMPAELRAIMIFGIAALLMLAVFNLIKT